MVVAGFALACLSLVVAGLSAGWQVYAWVLDGRRVRLALVHGVLGRAGAATGLVGRDRAPNDLSRLRSQGFDGPEVVGVSVTNVGRAPVRIDRYGVQLVEGGMSFLPVGDALGPELPFRLPPGETETWYAKVDDARALVFATRGVVRRVSNDVRMTVDLGTGDTKRTRRSVLVGDGE